jgi:Uma2 family endonuclease
LLADHVDENALGRVFVEVPFVMTDPGDPNWVTGSRVPDAMFYNQARIDELAKSDAEWRLKPLPIPPDLAVEVNRFSAVSKKIDGYLSDDDTLTGDAIVPGFSVSLVRLFAAD